MFLINLFHILQNGPSTNCVSKLPKPPTGDGTYQKCKVQDAHCTGVDEKNAFLYGLADGK